MKQNYNELPNGYLISINKGIRGVQRFSGGMTAGSLSWREAVKRLKKELETADAIVVGAGAGLSTAAGFTYSGERYAFHADPDRADPEMPGRRVGCHHKPTR